MGQQRTWTRMGVAKVIPAVAYRDAAARSGGRDGRQLAVMVLQGAVAGKARLRGTRQIRRAPG